MTLQSIAILLAAGFFGGVANSMAGGASLVTFPAMMAAGLAPIPANASNTVALIFGNIMGAWTERSKIPAIDRHMCLAFGIAIFGGVMGALLLLYTPEKTFVGLVPALVGIATLIFAFSKPIQMWLTRFGHLQNKIARAGLLFPTAIYGGYFGAGMGVIFMAVLSATSDWTLRPTNAVKNILGALANGAAIAIFVLQDIVSWPQTAVMMVACTAGGYVGGKALALVSSATMKKVIVTVGAAMTLFYTWHNWLSELLFF